MIATGRFSGNTLADRKAKACAVCGVWAVVDDEPGVVVAVPTFEKGREVC